ncbi:MAG: murein biosynthesis integral membrane protein MurJ [Candidatus Coatesbacteria bacterium]|nr:murein biosynthesis integral membrane protein MurJ [Candidatus Coatesbacteria bacterium]
MSERKSGEDITRAASVVGIGTLFSRILGLFRDVLITSLFPAGTSLDAFVVAFRIPNLLRRLFGEGALNAAFIPVFSEYLTTKSRREAFDLARIVMTALVLILAVISAIGMVFAPQFLKIQVPGWSDGQEMDKMALTANLLRLMFPYVILICLTALSAAMLNTLKHFASGAFYPVLLNVSIIGSALILGGQFDEPVMALAVGVLIGGVLQLLLQLPPLIKRRFYYRPMLQPRHPGLRRIVLLMLPSMIAFGVVEINAYVDMLLASFLAPGSNSYLFFANRLVQLPLALFGIAVATPILPKLSKLAAKGETADFRATFGLGMRLIVFFTLPSSAGLILLRRPIVNLLYERGAFTRESTDAVAFALLFYAVGVFAFAAVKIAATAFYARKDTKTPVIVAAVALLSNVVLNIILMQFLAHGGLALASSISSFINLVLLLLYAAKKRIVTLDREETTPILKSVAAAVVMTLTCWALLHLVGYDYGASLGFRILQLSGIVVGSIAVFIFVSKLIRCEELGLFISSFTRRRGGRRG